MSSTTMTYVTTASAGNSTVVIRTKSTRDAGVAFLITAVTGSNCWHFSHKLYDK